MDEVIPKEGPVQAVMKREESPGGRAGGREGLEQLFREQHRMVFQAAYRVTGNAMDAEDAVQTVFLRLLRRDGTLALATLPPSYLHMAAVNAALDILRGRASAKSTPLDDVATALVDEGAPGPEAQAEATEAKGMVRRALGRLNPKTAEIFSLKHLEGHTNREIAKMLGRSQTFVAVATHRARKRLRDEIRKEMETTDETR